MLKYCLNRHKPQEISDKAVDTCLPTLKFVTLWFVTNKIIEKLDQVVFSNDYIDLDDINSYIFKSFSDGMNLVTVDLYNINLDDNKFDEDDPEFIVPVTLIGLHNRYKQLKKR